MSYFNFKFPCSFSYTVTCFPQLNGSTTFPIIVSLNTSSSLEYTYSVLYTIISGLSAHKNVSLKFFYILAYSKFPLDETVYAVNGLQLAGQYILGHNIESSSSFRILLPLTFFYLSRDLTQGDVYARKSFLFAGPFSCFGTLLLVVAL